MAYITEKKEKKEKNIINCLESLNEIDYPKNLYKIIIINDNSIDKTVEISKNFFKQNNIKNYKIINRTRQDGFVAGVLNDGIKSCNLDNKSFFGIIDSDCIVSTNILKKINSNIIEYNLDAIQTQEWHITSDNYINSSQHILCSYENYNNFDEKAFKVGHFFSNNIAKKIKYNEKSILEDRLFSDECKKNNFKIKVIKDVLLYRKFSSNFMKVYSQQYRYQLGSITNDIKNKKIIDTLNITLVLIFSFLININLFYKILIYLLLEVFCKIFIYYKDYHRSALINSPYKLINIINKQKNILTINNIFSTTLFMFFVLILRIIPFYRILFNIETIRWNRF